MSDTGPARQPCYYCNDAGCGHCDPDLDMTPAGIVYRAVDALGSGRVTLDRRIAGYLADLFQIVGDGMNDEDADEKAFPHLIPAARWQVVRGYGYCDPVENAEWTAALALARAVLGLPDPNAAASAACTGRH